MPACIWSRGNRACAAGFAVSLLLGCPQLLDDDFSSGPLTTGPDGGASTLAGGSGGGTFNTAGAGGGGSGGLGGTAGAAGGVSGQGGAGSVMLASVREALAHRYSFDGIGDAIEDSAGASEGRLYATALDGRGFADLLGNGNFVNLSNGLVSSSNDKTLECWLTWRGGGEWQRIFDFGSSDRGEGVRGMGTKYLFLTPRAGSGFIMAAYSQAGIGAEIQVVGSSALEIGSLSHVAVAVDSATDELNLYVNGELVGAQTLDQRLSEIEDVNSWLGTSQYRVDPYLNAELVEFRIYDRALTPDELRLTYETGPDEL